MSCSPRVGTSQIRGACGQRAKITAPRVGAMVARRAAWRSAFCYSRVLSLPHATRPVTRAVARATARAASRASGRTMDRRAESVLNRPARTTRAVHRGSTATRSQTHAARPASARRAARHAPRPAAIPASVATRPARASRFRATTAPRVRRISSAIRRPRKIRRGPSTCTPTAASTCPAARTVAVPPTKRASTASARPRSAYARS